MHSNYKITICLPEVKPLQIDDYLMAGSLKCHSCDLRVTKNEQFLPAFSPSCTQLRHLNLHELGLFCLFCSQTGNFYCLFLK